LVRLLAAWRRWQNKIYVNSQRFSYVCYWYHIDKTGSLLDVCCQVKNDVNWIFLRYFFKYLICFWCRKFTKGWFSFINVFS
jgi:hypothetical protein